MEAQYSIDNKYTFYVLLNTPVPLTDVVIFVYAYVKIT